MIASPESRLLACADCGALLGFQFRVGFFPQSPMTWQRDALTGDWLTKCAACRSVVIAPAWPPTNPYVEAFKARGY